MNKVDLNLFKITVLTEVAQVVDDDERYRILDALIIAMDYPDSWWINRQDKILKNWIVDLRAVRKNAVERPQPEAEQNAVLHPPGDHR